MSVDFGFNPILSLIGDLRDYGIEWALRRYPGLYGGKVCCNVDDAQGQARALVSVGVLGVGTTAKSGDFTPTTISRRALPTSIYAGQDHGMYFPPEKGDLVWVSFDHGDIGHPRMHGSWWRNTDPTDPSKSEVPAEFRLGRNGELTSGAPKRRGIKTKYGHGIVFSDEAAAPYVALWAGKQPEREEGGVGRPAIVRQQITLVDADASGIPSANGASVDAGIYANTNEGLRLELNDKTKTVLLGGKGASADGPSDNSFEINDTDGKITIKTKGEEGARHEVVLNDSDNSITIKSKTTGQEIVLDGTTGNITIKGTGNVDVTATTAISLTGPAINMLGVVGITGAVAITGAATVAATSPDIRLGTDPATAKALATEDLITWLAGHTHGNGFLGSPTAVPIEIPGLLDPANKTSSLKGG